MGSQLRFDPSFFGLALRASAEADALLFSAHEGLSGITRPTRAGLRLTSPAKASGEWGKREDKVQNTESKRFKTPKMERQGG